MSRMKRFKQILIMSLVTTTVLGFTFPMMPKANATEDSGPEVVEIKTTSKSRPENFSHKRAFLDQSKKDANWGDMTLQERLEFMKKNTPRYNPDQ